MKSTELCRRLPKYWSPNPSPASMSSPRTKGGGYTLAGKWGSGRSIFWKTPDTGLASYSIISQSIELGPPMSRAFFFPLDHRGCEIWGPLPPAPPPIAASLIIPAIFWGQPVRPYALNFLFFPFLYSFFIFSFCYSLLIFFSFLFLFIHIFLSFSSYLFLYFLFFTYYSSSSYMRIKHTLGKITHINGKINDLQRKPRENSSLAKNPPKYTTAHIVQQSNCRWHCERSC